MPYQMEGSLDIAQRIIAQVDADLQAILAPEVFARYYPDVPAPAVSLEMIGSQPEPLHVFTWSTARDFGIEQNLSGSMLQVSFHVWVTCIGTGPDAATAAEAANAYHSMVLQMVMGDVTLHGLASEIMVPQVRETDAWADDDGRRHCGYLLDLEVRKWISPDSTITELLEAVPTA